MLSRGLQLVAQSPNLVLKSLPWHTCIFCLGLLFFFKLNSEVITSTEILGLFTIKSGVPPLERLEGLISGVCILTGQQELDLLEMGMDGPQSIQPRYTQPTSIHLDCLH